MEGGATAASSGSPTGRKDAAQDQERIRFADPAQPALVREATRPRARSSLNADRGPGKSVRNAAAQVEQLCQQERETAVGDGAVVDGGGQPYSVGQTFAMGSTNVTLYAVWSVNQYTLTVTMSGSGTTSPVGAQSVSYGAATPITATPSPLYHFVNWTVTAGTGVTFASSGTSTSASGVDGVSLTGGNATIQANFALSFFVNAASGNDGNAGTTPTAPFKTISKALSVATVSGEIVNVAPGTYNTANGEIFPPISPPG